MSKKTRYILLFIGFILFLILAPIILFYVRGITYDLSGRRFVKTGILAIKTDPKNTEVFIDGKLKLKNSGSVRFLPTKEYEVVVRKEGYFEWSKRLPVLAGQVTWASPEPNKLYMFLKNPEVAEISSGVTDVYAGKDFLLYLSGNSLAYSETNNPARSENFSLSGIASSITASPNGQIFALTGVPGNSSSTIAVFDRVSRSLTDLGKLFPSQPILKFSADNRLYALHNRTLFRIDPKQKTIVQLKDNVAAFGLRENNLYYLERDESGQASLLVSDSPEEPGTPILERIPAFNQGEVFVNFERQALLLLDGSLYQVSSELEKLAEGITEWEFDYAESSLVFFHSGQLSFYNPFSHSINFINRSSLPITEPLINLGFGNVFFVRDNRLETLELDARSRQNNYVLYQGQNLQKFLFNPDLTKAYIIDNGVLKVLKIR